MTLDILVPYYGEPALLQQTVRSVLAQDDPDWRLTVVDDRVVDDDVPAWFAGLGDPRVRYLRNEVNLGANRNFQRCLDLAEHELMTMVGSDDVLLPSYVRTVVAAHRAVPGAAIVQPGVQVVDADGRPVLPLVDRVKRAMTPRAEPRAVVSGERLAASLLHGDWLYFPSLCWRTASAQEVGFSPDLHTVMDLSLILGIVLRDGALVVDPAVCFQYRRHAASESSWRAAAGTRFAEERAFFLDMRDTMAARGWRRAARAAGLHATSRLHALALLPTAARRADATAARTLLHHALVPPSHRG